MHAIIGGGEEEDGRREWTVELTLPLYNGPENARIRVQIYGLWPHREGGRERGGENHRQFEVSGLEYCCGAESAPAWYAHAAGKRKAATGGQGGNGGRESKGGGPL